MADFPSAMPGAGLTQEQQEAIDSIVSLPDNSIPRAYGGKLAVSSTNQDAVTEEWLFDKSIEVPQASVKISDTLSISEATLLTLTRDKVQSTNIISVGSSVLDDEGSSKLNFQHVPSGQVVAAQPIFDTMLTANPLAVPLLATRSNQTDRVTLKIGSPMSNFRAAIVDNTTGITLKYIPSRAAVDAGTGGLELPVGDVSFFFNDDSDDVPSAGLFYLGFTPLRQSAGQASTITFFADNINILGDSGGTPYFENEIHFLEDTVVPFLEDVTNLSDSYTRINNGYTELSPTTSGVVSTYSATSTVDTITNGRFVQGFDTINNPNVITDGSNTFTDGDLIQIKGTVFNDGLYEVDQHTGNVLFIKGVGTISNIEDFTSSDFITTKDTATVTKVNISVIRSSASGEWEQGKGSSTPIAFSSLSTGGSYLGVFADLTALQSAYPVGIAGDTATVTNPNGNMFYWNVSMWSDSGTGYIGDMLKSVYDPTSKNADVFNMGSMTETATAKVFSDTERTNLGNQSGVNTGDQVYGTQRHKESDLSYTITTNEFATPDATNKKLVMVTSNLPSGTYVIKAYFQFLMEKDKRFEAAIWHDNTSLYLNDPMKYKSDENSDELSQSFMSDDLVISGINTFELRFGPESSMGDQATMGDAVMELIRVG